MLCLSDQIHSSGGMLNTLKKLAFHNLLLDNEKSVTTYYTTITKLKQSRHTVVCRAAQEAIVSHRVYIDRKTKNVIFTYVVLRSLTQPKFNQIFCRDAPEVARTRRIYILN